MVEVESPVDLFGDESNYKEIIVYGLVIVPINKITLIENIIDKTKKQYGVNSLENIHCRELFHYHARDKTGWKHLNKEDIFDFSSTLLEAIYKLGIRFSIGIADLSDNPSKVELLEDKSSKTAKIEKKLLCNQAYFAALSALEYKGNFKHIRKIWLDPDNTKIDILGHRNKINNIRGITFLNLDKNLEIDLQPETIKNQDKKTILLQVADLFSYISAHAISRNHRDKIKFLNIYNKCKPLHRHIHIFDEIGKKVNPELNLIKQRQKKAAQLKHKIASNPIEMTYLYGKKYEHGWAKVDLAKKIIGESYKSAANLLKEYKLIEDSANTLTKSRIGKLIAININVADENYFWMFSHWLKSKHQEYLELVNCFDCYSTSVSPRNLRMFNFNELSSLNQLVKTEILNISDDCMNSELDVATIAIDYMRVFYMSILRNHFAFARSSPVMLEHDIVKISFPEITLDLQNCDKCQNLK